MVPPLGPGTYPSWSRMETPSGFLRASERASEPELRPIGCQFSDLPLRLLSSRLLASSCGSEPLTCHPAALPAATRAEAGREAPFVTHVKPLVRRMFIGVAFLRKGCS